MRLGLQIRVLLVRQRHGGSLGHFLVVLIHQLLVDLDLGRSEGNLSDELQSLVANKLASEPQERFLEVVVRLGRDVVVLQVLLAMEGDGLGLDFALLNIDFVTAEDDGHVFANSDKVTMPVGNILVGYARCDIEHDDTALAVDVITVSKSSELLLPSCVPHIELNLTEVGGETERVNFYSECGNVFLFEFSSKMSFDECGLSCSTIANKHKLEAWDLRGSFRHPSRRWLSALAIKLGKAV